ncbi:MAG: hypothetical protein K0R44_846 [Thermomicrobiales bacterium]|nr:hypothetical protein [Thermomicrobiales bacterium]
MPTRTHAISDRNAAAPAWRTTVYVSGQRPEAEAADPSLADRSAALVHHPTLRIRPYSIADMPALVRFPGVLRLDVPESLLLARPGVRDLPAALPVLRKERPAFVAIADGQLVGFVRFSPRRPDGRWVISAIGASTGVYAPEPVWEALLAHGVRSAGLRGVRRLFARVPADHPLVDTMHQNGWVSYSRETVFRAEHMSRQGRSGQLLRLQEPADTWAIHQLYAAAVPRQVQEIEALTSHVWDMDQPRRGSRRVRQTGWLLEENGELTAYARYTRGSQAGMIDAVVLPGNGRHLGMLLDGISAVPRRGRPRPVYCAMRAYFMDLKDELTERAFSAIGEQELLIRYTTATARSSQVEPVYFPVELRQGLPRRVPTFLESQPTDGTI